MCLPRIPIPRIRANGTKVPAGPLTTPVCRLELSRHFTRRPASMEPRHLRLVEDRAAGYIGEGFLIALA